MTGEHLEIERKFDVDPSFVVPDLSGVAGVASVDEPAEHELAAVYHDTADLRLARARVTLRRRSGGTDAGWHLKLPAGSARRELHQPLGRATRTPPRTLLEPVAGILRGAPTGAVASLRTRRVVTQLRGEDGRVLAEVADDSVSAEVPASGPGEPAEVHAWREVEVELVDGGEELLLPVEAALLAAGARPAAAASKLGRVLASRLPAANPPGRKATAGAVVLAAVGDQVRALQQADVLVRTEQPDGVHDLRVACRRLRSILAAFRPVLAREATDPLRDELAWLGRELSAVRDGEVALASLRRLVGEQPEELVLGPVAARLQQTALKEAHEGGQRARTVLSEARYLRLLDDLFALLDQPPWAELAGERARSVLRDAVRRGGRRLRRRIEAARDVPDADRGAALHEVRKAAKRLRYTTEVAAPVLGRRAGRLVACMERVQDVLGERQDTDVAREYCRRVGLAAAAAGENAWTYGRLHGLEEARAERAAAAFWAMEREVRRVLRGVRKKS